MLKVRETALLFLFATMLSAAVASDGKRWWSFVEFLASDQLEGRNTGSEGHRKAAEYVASQFDRNGLRPAGERGYIQPVKFRTIELDEEPGLPDGQKVTVSIVPSSRSAPLAPGEGIRRSAGGWSDDADGLERFLEWNRQQRKIDRPEIAE